MENKEKLKEIIAGCLQNKRKAQQELFQFFYGRMLTVCLRYTNDRDTAQEVLQEGFIIRTHRGRVATEKAYQHLGINKGGLF